jgi:hypothetical protein
VDEPLLTPRRAGERATQRAGTLRRPDPFDAGLLDQSRIMTAE